MYLNFSQSLLCLVILSVTLFYLFLRRKYAYWKNRGIPYEEPNLLMGNFSFVMRSSITEYLERTWRKFPKEEYVGIFRGWKPTLLVQTPELAKRILTKDFDYFQNRTMCLNPTVDPLGALNVFTVKNPIWSTMRHELTPMFTSSRLRTLTQLMNLNGTELVRKIKRDHIDGNLAVNLKELFSMYTSDSVGSTVFGISVSALNDESNSPLWVITSNMVKWTFRRGLEFTIVLLFPALGYFLRLSFFSVGATNYIKKLFWDVVKERKQTGESNDKDLVNHLLKLKKNLRLPAESGTELADNLMLAQASVFILGSIETSSTTLSYCLHELAHHPEIQEKLYEEIDGAMKRTGKEILDYEDLLELKYLTACIMETLRKHPPVPFLDRECFASYKLNDDVTIEPGTGIFINLMAIHKDPNIFPEPDEWRPERMANVCETDNMQYSLLPFGDGPHYCIGRRYGMMQIRAAMAQMIHKYRILPLPDEPYQVTPDPYAAFLAPISGGRVKFELR